MKFTLTYDGPLPASANKSKKQDVWDIRKKLDPQLRDLWASHPALRFVEENRYFPKTGGTTLTQVHHLHPGPIRQVQYGVDLERTNPEIPEILDLCKGEILDLCEGIEKFGAWFRPLVRESHALHCGLNVKFLRKEPPGKVYQGGDLDGRIKTLFDALTMPQHVEQIIEKTKQTEPMYCLLEEDSLVSGCEWKANACLLIKTIQRIMLD